MSTEPSLTHSRRPALSFARTLSSPRLLTAEPPLPFQPLLPRYLAYLDGFAAKFDLMKNIHFRTAVLRIRKCPKSGKWLVTSKGGCAVEPHRTYGAGAYVWRRKKGAVGL